MKHFILILAHLFIVLEAFSQNPSITQQVAFGGTGDDYILGFESISNQYYFAGFSNSNSSATKSEDSKGGTDIWLLKTDENLNTLWDKTIGGSEEDILRDYKIIDNKMYLITTSLSGISGDKTSESFGQEDLWMLCVDLNGNIIWQKQYGGDGSDYYPRLTNFTDTSLLITSLSYSSISGIKTTSNIGSSDIWLLEVGKSNGEIIQQKSIGSNQNESLVFIDKSTINNHYYLRVKANEGINGDKTDGGFGGDDIWLLELDENLNILKDKCFGGLYEDYCTKSMLFDQTGFFITGISYSGVSGNKSAVNQGGNSSDAWLIRLDLNWHVVWDKTYGGSGSEGISSFFKNSNGNYVLSAVSSSYQGTGNKTSQRFNGSFDSWLVILNENGEILAQETYGGNEDEDGRFYPIPQTDNKLLLICSSASGISGNKTVPNFGSTQGLPTSDVWVATLDASDFLNTKELNPSNASVSVYPNPFIDELSFRFNQLNEDVTITFYSLEGKQIDSKKIKAGTTDFTWTTPSTFGMVFYEIKGAQSFLSGKVFQE